jgi:hypothetical protein
MWVFKLRPAGMSTPIRSGTVGKAMKNNVWEIVKKEDGTFDLFHSGKLLHESIPEDWLADQLGRYGFCGQEYDDIRYQLDLAGRAKIVL